MANFKTLGQLFSQPVSVIRFLITYLLPASGLAILAGKPKSGKTTLARQLILAVATGASFLGFDTVQCSVLYYAIEERASEVLKHFREMGARGDEPIEIHTGPVGTDWLVDLERRLNENPKIKLVVVDPLLLAVHVKDANDYAQMMKALFPLVTMARRFEVAILCAHHDKKSNSADAGDNLLGSTAIRASGDAIWHVTKLPDGKRTFQTEMRYGTDLPTTNLIFDEDFRISRLGSAQADIERQQAAVTKSRIEQEIITVAASIPLQTKEEILSAVAGNTGVKYQVFGNLERQSLFARTGSGVKGDPYRYTMAVPVEVEQPDPAYVAP